MKSCVYFSTFSIYIHFFPCENQIGPQLVYFLRLLFDVSKPSRWVRSVDSGSKFYWLPPNKENNADNPYSELGNPG